MAGDDDKEYTVGGNIKAPSFSLVLSWVKEAYGTLSTLNSSENHSLSEHRLLVSTVAKLLVGLVYCLGPGHKRVLLFRVWIKEVQFVAVVICGIQCSMFDVNNNVNNNGMD